jgi:carboxymethylenebutenolidase
MPLIMGGHMPLQTSWVQFGATGNYRGFSAKMQGVSGLPGLLLIQEAWGVDGHIQDMAARYAEAGYAVLAPDLYSEDGRRPEPLADARIEEAKEFLNSLPPGAWGRPDERDKALAALPADKGRRVGETMGTIFGGIQADKPKHLKILHAAEAWIRQSSSKVAALGFCMGGGLAGLCAVELPGLAAAVIFYGQGIPKELVPNVGCKVLALHGASDARLVDALPEFEKDMREAGKSLEVHVYRGAGHAFLNDTRPSYAPSASREAFARSLAFLAEMTR